MTQTVGITSLSYYIPSGIMTSEDMSKESNIPEWVFTDKIGILRKPIASRDEHPTEMAVKAALAAIEKAGITPQDVDIIAYCGAGDYDYRFWSPAAKVQGIIDCKKAYAFEVRNFCNSGNLGLHLCRNMLLADPELSYALVICSDKLSSLLNYSDPDCVSTFIMADGAIAAILKKGERNNQLLAYHALTDGKLADYLKVPLGGTQFPVNYPDIDPNLGYLKVSNPKKLEIILSDIYLENYQKVILQSLRKSNLSVNNINFLFTNQVKTSLSSKILETLKLTEEQTYISLREYGHLGAVDTLFGLAKALEENKIKPGQVVVLASSATGFSWAALTVKYSG